MTPLNVRFAKAADMTAVSEIVNHYICTAPA